MEPYLLSLPSTDGFIYYPYSGPYIKARRGVAWWGEWPRRDAGNEHTTNPLAPGM